MTETSSLRAVPQRLWELLLDGDTAWGSVSIHPQRWGATCYRIVIYPPGITAAQRRRVRLWRGFPAWGAALWLSATAVISGFIDPWPAVVLAGTAVLAAGTVSYLRAGRTRALVRSTEVTVPLPHSDTATLVRARLIQTIGAAITRADIQLRDGEISHAHHETVWWQAYDQLGPYTTAAPIGRCRSIR